MKSWTRVEDVICPLLQANQSEEWNLEKVHWNIELEHERGKGYVGIIHHCYEEDPAISE